ncbi:MAG TPA: hypothetical protein VF653_09490, partial [Methylomirabilota bacterium]
GKLKKVAVTGGPAQTICDAPSGFDASWSTDGVIAFDGGGSDPILRVSAAGGVASVAVPTDSGGVGWPEFLPDGRHMLYLRLRSSGAHEVWVADLRSDKRRLLGTAGSRVEYSPAGYLLYVKDRTLVAQPFDARALRFEGEPMPVVDGIGTGGNGQAHFSVSDQGALVYTSAGLAGSAQLVWVNRSGLRLSQVGAAGDILNLTLAPDGKRVAVRTLDGQTANRDIWILDPDRGTSTRFTFDSSNENTPLWSPDGHWIAFSSDRSTGISNLFRKPSGGAGAEESLLVSPNMKLLTHWSRDGRYIAYQERHPATSVDQWALPLFGDRKPFPVVQTPFIEGHGRISPDGRWIAYSSDESGRFEVYVQTFPGAGGKWQISSRGGFQPTWRADGRELYYLGLDGGMMAVSIAAEAGFAAGVPAALFNTRIPLSTAIAQYVPAADGQRFLIIAPEGDAGLTPLTVVLHWHRELQDR